MSTSRAIAVLGAGSWGTALAVLTARNGYPTRLWGHDPKHIARLQQDRCNSQFLPDIPFPETLTLHADMEECVRGVKTILISVPSHAFVSVGQQLAPFLDPDACIVWATKGLSQEGKFLSTHADELFGQRPYGMLSGPSFAHEIAIKMPTAVTLASQSKDFSSQVLPYFHCDYFRVYLSDDIIGVQLCGAVKNVLAIATGMCDGLGYGANTRAALITRGVAELTRLGIALGANYKTFMGLAGMGDIILTCTDNQSRNRRFGLALGHGQSAEEAKTSIGQVVEGAMNAEHVLHLAKQHNIEMPIIERICAILSQQQDPKDAVKSLFAREPKWE